MCLPNKRGWKLCWVLNARGENEYKDTVAQQWSRSESRQSDLVHLVTIFAFSKLMSLHLARSTRKICTKVRKHPTLSLNCFYPTTFSYKFSLLQKKEENLIRTDRVALKTLIFVTIKLESKNNKITLKSRTRYSTFVWIATSTKLGHIFWIYFCKFKLCIVRLVIKVRFE